MGLFVFFILYLKILSGSQVKEKPDQFVYNAVFTDKKVVLDGILDDPVWKTSHKLTLVDNSTGDPVPDSSLRTLVKTGYDHKNLYISFVCYDQDIWSSFKSRDQYLWTDDVVEVFIDTDSIPNTYVELEVSPRNVIFDSFITDTSNIDFVKTARFNIEGIKSAVKVKGTIDQHNDRDSGWIAEIAIPISSLTGKDEKIFPGKTKWRINYYRINRDWGSKAKCYSWSPTYGSNHTPSRFGVLTFE